jgi:hypothetical protein
MHEVPPGAGFDLGYGRKFPDPNIFTASSQP